MTNHASGTFDVRLSSEALEDTVGGPTVGRMSIDKEFYGNREGTSKGQMLSVTEGHKRPGRLCCNGPGKGILHGTSSMEALLRFQLYTHQTQLT